MPICETCLHRAVCGKYKATGGVNKCEHHKEERKGKWLYYGDVDADGNVNAHCSVCGAGETHAKSMVGKVPYCWECGAEMDGGKTDG